jgi:DNA-directed RNA polymerase specialized sigma24 family protein
MSRRELLAQVAATTAALRAAQDAHWRALLAADDDGATLAEMGEAMGINRQTVRWRIRAARKALGVKRTSSQ